MLAKLFLRNNSFKSKSQQLQNFQLSAFIEDRLMQDKLIQFKTPSLKSTSQKPQTNSTTKTSSTTQFIYNEFQVPDPQQFFIHNIDYKLKLYHPKRQNLIYNIIAMNIFTRDDKQHLQQFYDRLLQAIMDPSNPQSQVLFNNEMTLELKSKIMKLRQKIMSSQHSKIDVINRNQGDSTVMKIIQVQYIKGIKMNEFRQMIIPSKQNDVESIGQINQKANQVSSVEFQHKLIDVQKASIYNSKGVQLNLAHQHNEIIRIDVGYWTKKKLIQIDENKKPIYLQPKESQNLQQNDYQSYLNKLQDSYESHWFRFERDLGESGFLKETMGGRAMSKYILTDIDFMMRGSTYFNYDQKIENKGRDSQNLNKKDFDIKMV